jgi:hypothetical protein
LAYVGRLLSGATASVGTWRFWDSVVSLALFAVQFSLPVVLARRKRRRDAGRKPRLLIV